MDVFDDQQQRRCRADIGDQRTQRTQRSALAGGRVHRGGERPQVGRWRDIEQVMKEQTLLRARRMQRAEALERRAARVLVRAARDREQVARKGAHRVATGRGAEIEDRGGVTRKADRACHVAELRDEARLAHARIAPHDDDAAPLSLGAGDGHGGEVAQLFVAPDERRPAARRDRALAADPVRDQRLLLAFDLDADAGIGDEMIGDLMPGRSTEDDVARPGEAAQARRGVDGVAGQRVFAGATVAAAGDDEAGVDAGMHRQRSPDRRRERAGERRDRSMQFEGGGDGALRVVAMGERHAEDRHDLVADELIDDATAALDDRRGVGHDTGHDRFDFLRVQRLVQGGIARQVGEHDGGIATLALVPVGGRGDLRRRFRPASRAEPLIGGKGGAALRAGAADDAAARAAEMRARRIVGSATCAMHRESRL